jgi:hypothetical protein
MRQKSGSDKVPAEQVLKDIRRQTRRQHSAEEKIRIVLEGLRAESTRSFAAGRASLPRCITAGPRSSLRPVSADWPGTPPALPRIEREDPVRRNDPVHLCAEGNPRLP